MAPACVDEALRDRLKQEFAPISDSLLRSILLESGLPLDPMVEGVRQDDLCHLERTLLTLSECYEQSDANQRKRIRGVVITAKTHARYSHARAKVETKQNEKEEALLWLRTWLENPSVFAAWLVLRKNRTITEVEWTPPE